MERKIFTRPGPSAGQIARHVILAAVIAAGAALCVCHASCQLTSQGIQALNAEESPQITGVSILNASSIEVGFTKPVTVQRASVSRLEAGERAALDMTAQNPILARAVMSQGGTVAVYIFEREAELGERYQLFSEIKDARGNSLTFALPFDGFNERLPYCVLAEVQPKGSSSKSEGDESPYVIIRALEDGNLFGLELFCAKKQRTYALPKVEVKAGEEVTLHLRNTKDIDACKSELGSDLALAKTRRSSNSKRDIFFEQGVPLDEANDVILLRQRNSNKAVDALSYFTTKDNATDWNLPESAQKAVKDGAWQGPGSVESAFLANDGKNKYTTSQPMVRSVFPSAKDRRPSSKYDWTISAQKVYAKR